MSKSEVIQFYSKLSSTQDSESLRQFRAFLDRLFAEREMNGCTFFTSHWTLCIVRYPTYLQWRFKPLLALGYPSVGSVLIELCITQTLKPAYRTTTESSHSPYDIAIDEFDSLYAAFLDAHGDETATR